MDWRYSTNYAPPSDPTSPSPSTAAAAATEPLPAPSGPGASTTSSGPAATTDQPQVTGLSPADAARLKQLQDARASMTSANATRLQQLQDARQALVDKQTVADFQNQSLPSRLGTISEDYLGALKHGAMFGFDDRIDALANSLWTGNNYSDVLAARQKDDAARSARLNSMGAGTATTLDLLGGLALPTGWVGDAVKGFGWAQDAAKTRNLLASTILSNANNAREAALASGKGIQAADAAAQAASTVVPNIDPVMKTGVRFASNLAENAGYGALSAAGHGEDPMKGAGYGAAGSLLIPGAGRAVGAVAPFAGKAIGGFAGGHILPGLGGALVGGDIGSAAGGAAKSVLSSDILRNILTKLSILPGRQAGQLQGGQ